MMIIHNGGSGETPGPTVIVWMGEGREELECVQRWNLSYLAYPSKKCVFCTPYERLFSDVFSFEFLI